MSQFQEMLKEAFLGAEPFDPSPGREALEASIRKFEQRDRTLRRMLWFAVLFMSVLCYWAGWRLLTAEPEVSTKSLIVYATLFLFATQAIGWAKLFLFSTQQSLSLQKELKRTQLFLLEGR